MSSDACTGGNSQYYFYLNFHFSPNSFSYRGSYFKLGGEGFTDFVDSCRGGGAVTQGVVGGVVVWRV